MNTSSSLKVNTLKEFKVNTSSGSKSEHFKVNTLRSLKGNI